MEGKKEEKKHNAKFTFAPISGHSFSICSSHIFNAKVSDLFNDFGVNLKKKMGNFPFKIKSSHLKYSEVSINMYVNVDANEVHAHTRFACEGRRSGQ